MGKAAAAAARPRSAQQGFFERGDRVTWRPRLGAKPQQGCFNNASNAAGSRPPSATCAASIANTPALVSASESPPESSTWTCQRSSAATTRRASARSGVTRAAVLSGAFDRFAQTTPRWQALPLRRSQLRSCPVSQRLLGGFFEFLCAAPRLPTFSGRRRAQCFRYQ